MRKSGHDIFDGLLRTGEQRGDDRLQRLDRTVGGSAGIQAEIGRDLVVARARRVQLFAHLSDARNKLVFDEGVDVLLPFDGEFARFDVRINALQTLADRSGFLIGDDAALSEHRGVRDGRGDIRAPEFFVERERFVERVRIGCGGRVKSSFPKFHRVDLVLSSRRVARRIRSLYNISAQNASAFGRNARAAHKFLDRTPPFGVQ